jgi:hypothetical protein
VVYVAGITFSSDFPVTTNAIQMEYGGGQIDTFYSRFDVEVGEPQLQTAIPNWWLLLFVFLIVTVSVVAVVVRIVLMPEEPTEKGDRRVP